jgi:hypothetical protein
MGLWRDSKRTKMTKLIYMGAFGKEEIINSWLSLGMRCYFARIQRIYQRLSVGVTANIE